MLWEESSSIQRPTKTLRGVSPHLLPRCPPFCSSEHHLHLRPRFFNRVLHDSWT